MASSDADDLIGSAEGLKYAMRNTEARSDPWIPASQLAQFSDYAVALIELMGNEGANRLMGEVVIIELGVQKHRALRAEWLTAERCWIDMCAEALKAAGKMVP